MATSAQDISTAMSTYAIIPHPVSAHVLLVQAGDTWTLPHYDRFDEEGAAALNRATKRAFGFNVTVLYSAYEHDDAPVADGMEAAQIVVMELHDADSQLPPTGRWVDAHSLQQSPLAIPPHAAVIAQWFQEHEASAPLIQRRPWARPGWYRAAVNWLTPRLTALGYQVETIEQLALTDWSCILRIHAPQGDGYLKCCDSAFPHEPALTRTLAHRWPDVVPSTVAINDTEKWLLMQDAGQPLDELPALARDLACWRDIIAAYMRLQLEAITHRDQLLAIGCPDRRLEHMQALYETALADEEAWCVGCDGGLSLEEVAQLRDLTPRLRERLQALATYGIPATLHHDDLHAGNILAHGGRFRVIDWAESMIARPYFSLAILRCSLRTFTDDEWEQLSEEYLLAWTRYASLEQARQAFALAQPLGLLCRGLTWRAYLTSLDPQVRQRYAVNWPHWLRLFLQAMTDDTARTSV